MKKYQKNREFGALNVYKLYWESYLGGDLEAFSLHIDEDFEMIGTSESEVCHCKDDGIVFFKAQMHEIVGKTEMRNRNISAKPLNGMFLINEICDVYIFGIPEWTFYSKLRISTILHETDSGWKVIQQHGSLPDIRVQEGETIAFDKITKENLELRDAVKRRTVELEHKNRELAIEAALEKIRSCSLSMQKTDDLRDVVKILFEQMQGLSVNMGFATVSIFIFDEGSRNITQWIPVQNGVSSLKVPFFNHPISSDLFVAKEKGEDFFTKTYTLEEKNSWLEIGFEQTDYKDLPEEFKSSLFKAPSYAMAITLAKNSGICIPSFVGELPYPEDIQIMKRVGKVFEQAYIRFLDLQKAEAQAREAQIEAALERVRAQTMAMHSSEDVGKSVVKMFSELTALGVDEGTRFGIGILNHENENNQLWTARKNGDEVNMHIGNIDMASHPLLKSARKAWKEQIPIHRYVLEGEDLLDYYQMLNNAPDYKIQIPLEKLPKKEIQHCFIFEHGFFYAFSPREFQPELIQITKRFSSLFEQTYRRYLDLVRAETQAREAQIEAALEKVRSRSLAMQSPDELNEVARLLREEMGALGVEELETSSIYIQDESSSTAQCWFTIKNPDNPDKAITDQMTLDLQDTRVGRKMYEFVHSKAKQTSILMQGEERIEWIRYCEEKSDLFGTSNFYGETIPDRTYHLYKFSNGYIGAAAPGEISSESWDLLKRATAVFSFAYTRFRDLQMAQSSARAAMRQASLDRVRADISSMRNADDLDRITPLVFNELTTLGIPFIRCGVFIVHENRSNVEIYLSTHEGKSLAVMTLPFTANEMTSKSVEAWRNGEVYIQHWNQTDFINWGKSMKEQGYVKDLKTYQGTEAAPESLHLHFVPFAQGLLYVGSTISLSDEQIDLVKALAKSFAIAYARYEDFVKLEKAKAEVESAMSELKATQSQLVQQEKLASLGQLTAGIAHEIKNPLNFVNNFSEVSVEMIEEALEEFEKREARDETLIRENLEDIKSNLQKVHQHGSRANGIVTSMLQHSREGTGKKEPTDLNALIKEYVNLSFHGMRAGKNPIDVEIILDLDPEVKEVPLIKEDFTRVIINLCNNAFDAMKSVKTLHAASLSIRTKKQGDTIIIEVSDNGPGIPDDIKDKILQPFFTTKKGTEGTGLGLSITHDIVKAHGGGLSIESKFGQGATFIISLPKIGIL
ncbi:ATP-binding protein [Aquiflexum sp. LQ15W]|uniref:ATP-binding protein n=1 Tax=Cognataquiflexum nitidum TaxID=2922272 RepID=UPI001F1374CC|nr:ATP-binding protein [Cognataquiflexum nitidum]MCH6202060.1 ATP-binding protein [Cognataquiflexum nitidum]